MKEESVLEDVMNTVTNVVKIIDKLPADEQAAVWGYLDRANKAIGEARESLAKARAIAGINDNNQEI